MMRLAKSSARGCSRVVLSRFNADYSSLYMLLRYSIIRCIIYLSSWQRSADGTLGSIAEQVHNASALTKLPDRLENDVGCYIFTSQLPSSECM